MLIIPDSRAWVEVDTNALCRNFLAVKRRAGRGVVVIPMLKADAYGVGAERVARALDPLEPWALGVSTAEEGAALRRAGLLQRVMVCHPLPPQAVPLAAANVFTVAVGDLGGLERWAASAVELDKVLDFHVEVDTGLGRCGFDWRDTPGWSEAVLAVTRDSPVRWTGIFTHFLGADEVGGDSTSSQWERFQQALGMLPLPRSGLLVHAANSAAAMRWPEYAADAVRPGIYLYGGLPALGLGADELPPPEPVVSVRARLVLVREVPPGTTLGYGAGHVASDWERWGTLGIGYGDGLPRVLGGKGSALVRGRRVPILGRVSMDLTVVNLSTVPEAQVGDVATLIGADGAERITVDDVAAQAGTICNEILTRLTSRLPRLENGKAARSGGGPAGGGSLETDRT